MVLRTFCLIALLSCVADVRAQVPSPGEAAAPSAAEIAQMQAAQAASQAYYTRIASELAGGRQPRELAFAATLRQIATSPESQGAPPAGEAPSQASPRDPRVGQWRSLASARAGKDVLANVLLMPADDAGGTAVRAQAAARWQQIEPDNLAPLLFAGMQADTLLATARTRTRFDLHFYDQARWMQAALLAHPPTASERAGLLAGEGASHEEFAVLASVGIVAATTIPSLQPLTQACRGDALSTTATRREDCRHVAALMMDASDTNLGTMLGMGMQEALVTSGEERTALDARRRRFDWRMIEWGRISAEQPADGAAEFAQFLRDPAIDSEQVLVERMLGAAGVSLDPPAGWQSPRRER